MNLKEMKKEMAIMKVESGELDENAPTLYLEDAIRIAKKYAEEEKNRIENLLPNTKIIF